MNDNGEFTFTEIIVTIAIVIISFFLVVGICMALYCGVKELSLWGASKTGEAELNQASWNRQIAVKEAEAKKDSAIMLAQAEVERAKGVAKANKIIGSSLKNNEDYLRYLWIDHLENGHNQVIYVPTETNLPILEASRIHSKK